jgi:hypothetical protein
MLQMTQQNTTVEKLLDLPRSKEGIKIYLNDGGYISDGSEYILFFHIDGMYSYCKTEKGGYIHLSAMTPIKKYEDGYKLRDEHGN